MFGINDSGNQQDSQAPVSEPSVAPAPDAISSPVMPAPASDPYAAGDSGLSNSVAVPPIVTPAMTPPPPTEPTSAPAMPSSEHTQPESPNPISHGLNGVSLEDAYAPADTPQISSNYSKPETPSTVPSTPNPNNEDLLGIKHRALQSLAPLVDELDQTPEEKFKTTMMLIQASDNSDLVKEAFAAANAIPDEKTRAQALLDVVNEINYFTQPHTEEPDTI